MSKTHICKLGTCVEKYVFFFVLFTLFIELRFFLFDSSFTFHKFNFQYEYLMDYIEKKNFSIDF